MSVMGRVITGFSKPYVAKYTNTEGTVTYSDGQILARGVSVSLDIETSDNNKFFADNQTAETAGGVFTAGTATLTVDGTKPAARRMIYGLPTAGANGLVKYGEGMEIPDVGIGYIVRYMSEGVTSYVPQIIPKAKFNLPTKEAATQEDEIDWQTEELEAVVMRDDTEDKTWFIDSDTDYPTEAAAEAIIKTFLNIQ